MDEPSWVPVPTPVARGVESDQKRDVMQAGQNGRRVWVPFACMEQLEDGIILEYKQNAIPAESYCRPTLCTLVPVLIALALVPKRIKSNCKGSLGKQQTRTALKFNTAFTESVYVAGTVCAPRCEQRRKKHGSILM